MQVNGNTVSISRSEFVESLIWLEGKRMSLRDFPMHRAFYDGGHRRTLLKTCRQVAKTTTEAAFIVAESVTLSHFKTLFFSPSQEQTLKFSNLRVGKLLNYSPQLRPFIDENRVLVRTYKNGSLNAFSYALDDPDRLRGNSADRLLVDEAQDIVLGSVMPVAQECLAASDYKYETYAGTPKTFDNGIEDLWQESSMTEWVMKCTGCGSHNYVDSEKNFKPEGPICLKPGCGKVLDPRSGFWVDMRRDYELKGYHISQAIMPRNVPLCWTPGTPEYDRAVENWDIIMGKLKKYPIATFRNEVVGVSDSMGTRLVTLDDLKALCTGPQTTIYDRPSPAIMPGISKVCAGIDWSGGGQGQTSRTVLWIWGFNQARRYKTLYFEFFNGLHPSRELDKIRQVLAGYQPEVICCDAGEGNLGADELRRAGWHHRVHKIRYGSGQAAMKWLPEPNEWHVNKTKAVDSFMMWLLRKECAFPANVAIMEPVFKDVLAEFTEVTLAGQKIWRHSKEVPDDALHAMIFARLAMQMALGELDLTG
jgi:hypothetical protein